MSQTVESRELNRPVLEPILSEKYSLQLKHLLIALWFGAFFMHFNYVPLFHSDIWGHVAYGEWIIAHRALPTEDPFLKLAEGMPTIVTAWLGQVIFGAAAQAGGDHAISNVFAVTVFAMYVVLARVFYLQTGKSGLATIGVILAWLVGFSRHAIIRPEIFASLCFAILLWLVVRTDPDRARGAAGADVGATARLRSLWIGVPLVFLAWANLHGSFVMGFVVLGCLTLGRAWEVLWQTANPVDIVYDREFQRWVVLTELAIGATLVNPYGMDLLLNTFLFPANPNLKDVLEWFPLEMVSYEGIEIGLSWLGAATFLRLSQARLKPADVLMLLVMSLACCLRVRMITWYAPVLITVMMPHLMDVFSRAGANARNEPLLSAVAPLWDRSFKYTAFSALALWVAFAFSPVSNLVLGGKPRAEKYLYSRGTPLELTAWLNEHPPVGLVSNPQWWGDWLALKGPAEMELFMTTNAVHVVTPQVWKDYMGLARGNVGYENRLDRYRINTIIVHKELQVALVSLVRRLQGWTIVYEDDVGMVLTRDKLLPTAEETPPDDKASAH